MRIKCIIPTVSHGLFSGQVSVHLFGRDGGKSDYDCSALFGEAAIGGPDLSELPIYRTIESACRAHVIVFPKGCPVDRLFLPATADFNAAISHPENYCRDIQDEPIKKSFVPNIPRLLIKTGVKADGVVLERGGDACWFSVADCPTVIFHAPSGPIVVAHAGLRSLYRFPIGGEVSNPSHPVSSVVDSAVSEFRKGFIHPCSLRVHLCLGIGPENYLHEFGHPSFGAANEQMVGWMRSLCREGVLDPHKSGRIWLARVIEAQLGQCGVAPFNVGHDTIDTYSDTDSTGEYTWWSHRRSQCQQTPDGRNGALVVRNW